MTSKENLTNKLSMGEEVFGIKGIGFVLACSHYLTMNPEEAHQSLWDRKEADYYRLLPPHLINWEGTKDRRLR